MFYLLLALPHVLGMVVLLWIAYRTSARDSVGGADPLDGGEGDGGLPRDPTPDPLPSGGGVPLPSGGRLPLSEAGAPRRRLRIGEQLAELYPAPARREHPPQQPDRPRRTPGRS